MQAVRGALALGLFLLEACGRTEDTPNTASHGGRVGLGGTQNSQAGATDAGSPPGGANPGPTGGAEQGGSLGSGGRPASGGSTPAAGGAVTSGGVTSVEPSAGAGGSEGGAASAGSSGAGGAASCSEYLACGCGCCAAASSFRSTCFYPELKGDQEQVLVEDEAVRESSACATLACSPPRNYLCCDSANAVSVPQAEYQAALTVGALDRVQIAMTAGEDCYGVSFSAPALQKTEVRHHLEMPSGWGIDSGWAARCTMSARLNELVGAMGSVSWRDEGGRCLLDVDFTAFYAPHRPAAVLTTVRFERRGLEVTGMSSAPCQP